MIFVKRFFQNTRIERQPGQLSINETFGRINVNIQLVTITKKPSGLSLLWRLHYLLPYLTRAAQWLIPLLND